jgi:hypothetical protein
MRKLFSRCYVPGFPDGRIGPIPFTLATNEHGTQNCFSQWVTG